MRDNTRCQLRGRSRRTDFLRGKLNTHLRYPVPRLVRWLMPTMAHAHVHERKASKHWAPLWHVLDAMQETKRVVLVASRTENMDMRWADVVINYEPPRDVYSYVQRYARIGHGTFP